MSDIKFNTLNLVDSFKIKRLRDLDIRMLRSMTAPVIDGKEQRQILDTFISVKYVEDDKKGNLASFVVMSETNVPLAFSL